MKFFFKFRKLAFIIFSIHIDSVVKLDLPKADWREVLVITINSLNKVD